MKLPSLLRSSLLSRSSRSSLGKVGALALPLVACTFVVVACGSSTSRATFDDDASTPGGGFGDDGGFDTGSNPAGIGGRDPTTCAEAAEFKTYVGCDYYPTVTANIVQDIFDYAVAVANVGTATANVTVTGPNGVNQAISVAGGQLGKIYLPWVTALKGPASDDASSITASVLVKGGAYHLVSDIPVVVYQFNPLEFHGVGGPPGKSWSSCTIEDGATECYSYSNDASLLLPSTAMTGTYRIMGSEGFSAPTSDLLPPYFAVTGTVDGTTVTVTLGSKGQVIGNGSTIPSGPAGGTITFALDAGDVAEVVGGVGQSFDLSGSLLKADKPVQVITGVACMDEPFGVAACDHIEETVFPAETLGKHYIVMRPTGPNAADVGQIVHFYGNVDSTTLTYKPSKPNNCPDFLNAGQVVNCGEVDNDFEVSGDHEFGVGMFMLGGQEVDPSTESFPQGDPSQSFAVAVEQYRKTYVFLAPTDYKSSYVDVVASGGTTLTLDGSDVSSKLESITGTDYLRARIELGAGQDGAHSLTASAPVGIQVLGYGDNTSYQYPGGLNLSAISTAPVK